MIHLSKSNKKILLEVLKKNQANTMYISLIEENNVFSEHVEIYREYICNELINYGLNHNDEPNSYGLELETIIDELGYVD